MYLELLLNLLASIPFLDFPKKENIFNFFSQTLGNIQRPIYLLLFLSPVWTQPISFIFFLHLSWTIAQQLPLSIFSPASSFLMGLANLAHLSQPSEPPLLPVRSQVIEEETSTATIPPLLLIPINPISYQK